MKQVNVFSDQAKSPTIGVGLIMPLITMNKMCNLMYIVITVAVANQWVLSPILFQYQLESEICQNIQIMSMTVA